MRRFSIFHFPFSILSGCLSLFVCGLKIAGPTISVHWKNLVIYLFIITFMSSNSRYTFCIDFSIYICPVCIWILLHLQAVWHLHFHAFHESEAEAGTGWEESLTNWAWCRPLRNLFSHSWHTLSTLGSNQPASKQTEPNLYPTGPPTPSWPGGNCYSRPLFMLLFCHLSAPKYTHRPETQCTPKFCSSPS